MKIAVIGAGTRVGQPGFALMEELRHQGIVVEDPTVFIHSGPKGPDFSKRHTGAARIKRAAKQRRRRKG